MSYPKRKTQGSFYLTPEIVEAWRSKDLSLVARLLRLKPHECSPAWCDGRWLENCPPCKDEPGCIRAGEIRAAPGWILPGLLGAHGKVLGARGTG
jgi:hypothetical protein